MGRVTASQLCKRGAMTGSKVRSGVGESRQSVEKWNKTRLVLRIWKRWNANIWMWDQWSRTLSNRRESEYYTHTIYQLYCMGRAPLHESLPLREGTISCVHMQLNETPSWLICIILSDNNRSQPYGVAPPQRKHQLILHPICNHIDT